MMTPVVVVGAGLGGLRAAEQLRAAGYAYELVVIGDEAHLPYNRPPLSKEALAGGVSHEALAFRRKASVADVDWRLGRRVVSADLATRTLQLDDGSTLDYRGLVVATGVSSRRLPLDAPVEWRHVLRTIDDATALRESLGDRVDVVVIGAGFIGCEVAATASAQGCRVQVVDPLTTPMERPVGTVVGQELRRLHEAHGVTFRLGRTVSRIEGDADRPTAVVLDDGTRLPADVVVEAVGSVPNVSALAGQGLDLDDGVACDRNLHPIGPGGAIRDVVVVGDVARFPNPLFGVDPYRIEHWNMPTETAKRAARSLMAAITGEDPADTTFTPMPTFWSDQYGVRIQSFGMPSLGLDDVRVLEGDLGDEAAVGYHRDGRLVGLVLFGLSKRMLHYRGLLNDALTPHAVGVQA